jgi:hypothetical protein
MPGAGAQHTHHLVIEQRRPPRAVRCRDVDLDQQVLWQACPHIVVQHRSTRFVVVELRRPVVNLLTAPCDARAAKSRAAARRASRMEADQKRARRRRFGEDLEHAPAR